MVELQNVLRGASTIHSRTVYASAYETIPQPRTGPLSLVTAYESYLISQAKTHSGLSIPSCHCIQFGASIVTSTLPAYEVLP